MSDELHVTALAPILEFVLPRVVEKGDMLNVQVYGHKLRPYEIEKAGVVDRVIVLPAGEVVPLYQEEGVA